MGLIKCPECGHSVSSKAPFCPNCGVLIDGNIKRCPVCGAYALMAADHCPGCDTKFVVPTTSMPVSDHTEQSKIPEKSSVPSITPLMQKPEEPESPKTEGSERAESVDPKHSDDAEKATQPQKLVGVKVTPPSTSGKFTTWFILIAAILLIAIGGFFYFENQQQAASEERAFELLRDCNNTLNYEDFIARYPTSRHIEDVRARLRELHQEEALWQTVCAGGDARAFRQFLSEHPSTPYKKVALHKIDSLDWREAERIGTFAAYDAYVIAHDNGEYLDRVYSAREAARQREEQARRDSIAAARADSLANAAAAATLGIVAAE